MPEAIFEDGPVGTPYKYTVAGTGTVTPLACQAVYDGSGAGGDYVPAVIYRSQDGNVISRAILDSTITAGDDAEVSWFPGVKHAAGTSSTAPAAFVVSSVPLGNIGPGGTLIPWVDLHTNAASVFSIDPIITTRLLIAAPGWYLLGAALLTQTQPQSLTHTLTVALGATDAVGTDAGPILSTPIDVQDASAGDPKEVTSLQGFSYMNLAAGLVYPVHLVYQLTPNAVVNFNSASMYVSRLSPSAVS